ncbi:hypothetical protein QN277_018779 [Acacia crassicarpa]|uniref:Uncharacterized protein n=1 Tax=Acacia crassicarpa TaxID=499986 RepID=A0AAE1JUB5_9FABA|nr:hypothetical protein QN277_018779 [Acacia crassicarpa]
MGMSFSDEFSFNSAGASSNQEEDTMLFYSVPTSPTFKFKTSSLYGSDLDEHEFEFDTSRRFLYPCDFETDQRKEGERKSGDSMTFADELSCDGKVLPLPLKLPPRLQNEDGRKTSTLSSTASMSPRSLGLTVRRTFSARSLWNDDFDPFMVALKVVRQEEKRGKPKEREGIRRSKSELQIRSGGPNFSPSGLACGGPNSGPCELACGGPNEPLMLASRRPKMVLSEPKGLVFARKARLIGLDKNGSNGLNGPNSSNEESKNACAWKRKRKRDKIMKFRFGKASGHYKLRDQKNEIASEVKKMTLSFYKPRLLLCLGYGGRNVK